MCEAMEGGHGLRSPAEAIRLGPQAQAALVKALRQMDRCSGADTRMSGRRTQWE